jgi:hypothetical protein
MVSIFIGSRAERVVSKGKYFFVGFAFCAQTLFHFRPHVMEKILLRIAGVRAEVRGGKVAQPLLTGAAAGKI